MDSLRSSNRVVVLQDHSQGKLLTIAKVIVMMSTIAMCDVYASQARQVRDSPAVDGLSKSIVGRIALQSPSLSVIHLSSYFGLEIYVGIQRR